MAKIKFAHISDTHVLQDYNGSLMEGVCGATGKTPVDLLERAARYIHESCPDLSFVVVSGDVVHEGSEDDYVYCKSLLDRLFADIPVYVALGNHDRRAAFRAGYLGGGGDTHYDYTVTHGQTGLRLIVLDTSYDNSGRGKLENEQLVWLKDVLAQRQESGSILVLHHPPYIADGDSVMAAHGLANSALLRDIIEGSDIFAILSGHTHQVNATMFGGIPHYTADSTAFGVALTQDSMILNDRTGLALCTVENRCLSVEHIAFDSPVIEGARFSIAELLKMMQVHA